MSEGEPGYQGQGREDLRTFLQDGLVIDSLAREELRARVLATFAKRLTAQESQVLRMRYGVDDGVSTTLQEIGTVLGLTRERIRQIEMKATKKLQHPSRSKHLRDYLE